MSDASPSFTIRAAVPEDCKSIVEMIRELAVFEKLEHQMMATEGDLSEALFARDGGPDAFVAQLDDGRLAAGGKHSPGQLVGYAIFFENFSTFLCKRGLYLEDLYVRPDHRRRGIGKAFLKKLAETAESRGSGRLEWSVLDWNQNAIDVYESIGGKVLPEWRIVRMDGGAISAFARGE